MTTFLERAQAGLARHGVADRRRQPRSNAALPPRTNGEAERLIQASPRERAMAAPMPARTPARQGHPARRRQRQPRPTGPHHQRPHRRRV